MPKQPSNELLWTPAETKKLVSHADVIASLRAKAEKGTATPNEQTRFAKAVFELEKAVKIKERPAGDVIIATDAEGKEVRFDLHEIRQTADTFYRDHHLDKIASALPLDIRLTSEQEKRIHEAAKEGFDKAFFFAAPERMDSEKGPLITFCAKSPSAKLAGNEQYTEPYIDETAKNPVTRNRLPGKAYLLLYASKPVAQETKNLTFPQVAKLFEQKNWNGLTLQEYLILQRVEAESRSDHSFDAYSNDPSISNLTRLMDSTSDAAASRVLFAGWHPGNHQVSVHSDPSGDRGPNLGARSSVVLTLEP